jgi:uncharacterized protein
MLLSFRVSNYRSIKDEQEFSFVGDSRVRPVDDDDWDDDVRTVAGIFGANASGKSNVLRAFRFMHDAVVVSYGSWATGGSIPTIPFALEPSLGQEPSSFEVVLQFGKTRYQYGFRLTRERVVGEWLYVYATHRRQVWFERDADSADEWYFGKSFTGRNRVIADITTPRTLFLSAAAANNHKLARQVEHYIRAHMRFAFPDNRDARIEFTQGMSSDEKRWKSVVDLIQFADLGISDARVRRHAWKTEERQAFERVFRAMNSDIPEEEIKTLADRAAETVEFAHTTGVGQEATFLPLEAESLGTQTLFALTGPVIRAISSGDTLFVDEIDASLHPRLTCEIIRVFKDPKQNPKQAQIIFTSHDTTLLGGLLDEARLARDEVWFTEKKTDGATTLYPLTDFSPRKEENLERGYLQGRYGAVPYLHRNFLSDAIARELDSSDATEVNGDSEPDLDMSHAE